MKTTKKLTRSQAELLGSGYMCIKNAIDFLKMLNREPGLPRVISIYNSGWIADLTILQDKMDRRLNCNETFERDVKQNDTLRLLEISRIFQSLNPEGQAALEEMFLAIKNNEEIKVEVTDVH